MFGFRQVCLSLALAAGIADTALAQHASPQPKLGLQGSVAIGGGDKLGFAGTASLGPRIGGNLISVRATVGAGSHP